MSSSECYIVLSSLLILTVLLHPVMSDVFFPVETNRDLVQYRSLKDILFRSQSDDIAHSIESPVVASFRPSNPSPTLASSPQNGIGASKIRFLETDAFFIPNFSPVLHSEFIPPAISQTEASRVNLPNFDFDHTKSLVQQAKNAEINESVTEVSVIANTAQDRWPWPYSKPTKQAVNIESRQLQQSSTLIVKKAVAKPYRLLTRTSSCPKLLHDLTITCSLPKQQQLLQPVEFQWYKTQHRNVADTQNNLLESTIKTPIAFGTQMTHKDSRYGVSVVSDSANLTIRQLKPQDCGSYICEAVDINGAAVISTTEFLIFLCY